MASSQPKKYYANIMAGKFLVKAKWQIDDELLNFLPGSYYYYAYELMLCLHVFRQTGPPRRVDCLAPPSVCHIKTEASR